MEEITRHTGRVELGLDNIRSMSIMVKSKEWGGKRTSYTNATEKNWTDCDTTKFLDVIIKEAVLKTEKKRRLVKQRWRVKQRYIKKVDDIHRILKKRIF